MGAVDFYTQSRKEKKEIQKIKLNSARNVATLTKNAMSRIDKGQGSPSISGILVSGPARPKGRLSIGNLPNSAMDSKPNNKVLSIADTTSLTKNNKGLMVTISENEDPGNSESATARRKALWVNTDTNFTPKGTTQEEQLGRNKNFGIQKNDFKHGIKISKPQTRGNLDTNYTDEGSITRNHLQKHMTNTTRARNTVSNMELKFMGKEKNYKAKQKLINFQKPGHKISQPGNNVGNKPNFQFEGYLSGFKTTRNKYKNAINPNSHLKKEKILNIKSRDTIPREDARGEEKYNKTDRSYDDGKLSNNKKLGNDGCIFYQSPIPGSEKNTNRLCSEKRKNTPAGITAKTIHFSDMESLLPLSNGKVLKLDYNAQDENYF